MEHLEHALELLSPQAVVQRRQTLEQLADACFLAGRYERTKTLLAELDRNAVGMIDKVRIQRKRAEVVGYSAGTPGEAVDFLWTAAQQLGATRPSSRATYLAGTAQRAWKALRPAVAPRRTARRRRGRAAPPRRTGDHVPTDWLLQFLQRSAAAVPARATCRQHCRPNPGQPRGLAGVFDGGSRAGWSRPETACASNTGSTPFNRRRAAVRRGRWPTPKAFTRSSWWKPGTGRTLSITPCAPGLPSRRAATISSSL